MVWIRYLNREVQVGKFKKGKRTRKQRGLKTLKKKEIGPIFRVSKQTSKQASITSC